MIADLKPYPAMKDSGVPWLGAVPEHWTVKRGKALFHCVDVRSSTGEEELLTVSSERGVVPRSSATVTMFKAESYAGYKLCWPNDLVINSLWAWARGLGVARHHGIISSAYGVYRLRPSYTEYSAYVHDLVRSTPFNWELQVRSKGIWISRLQLTDEAFLGAPFPLPPSQEQAAIVRFLDHADRRIRRYIRAKQKLVKLLEEQKQALIYQIVTGRIDVRTGQPYPAYKDSGVEWLGDVPEHWEMRRLKSKLRPVDRRSSSGTETLLSLRRDFGVVVYGEHFSRPPQGVTLVGYKLVEAGQLVVNRLQANNGLLFCSRLSGVVSPDYSVFAARSPVDMEYLGNLLRTVTYKTHFRRESTGLGTGSAGFLRLYDDRLLETPVPLPPLEEQSTLLVSLSEITASLCRAIGRQHEEIALLREYRTRLIADVVTGKLDVRGAAAGLREVDPLADEFDAPPQDTGELGDVTESLEELTMGNEATV